MTFHAKASILNRRDKRRKRKSCTRPAFGDMCRDAGLCVYGIPIQPQSAGDLYPPSQALTCARGYGEGPRTVGRSLPPAGRRLKAHFVSGRGLACAEAIRAARHLHGENALTAGTRRIAGSGGQDAGCAGRRAKPTRKALFTGCRAQEYSPLFFDRLSSSGILDVSDDFLRENALF